MFEKRLAEIAARFQEIETLLSDSKVISDQNRFRQLGKEHADLKDVVDAGRLLKKIETELAEARALAKDPDMKELADSEIERLAGEEKKCRAHIETLLLPKDPNDDKNLFLEIRAGTGGDEAALFAGDLLRMYLRFAEREGFKTEIVDSSPTGLGGFKEVTVLVTGKGAYSRFKFESGTHRVQRVPKTEASGRIHTSAATVAVMPEAEEVELNIEAKDLRIDTYRASGAGGQHVNKTDSAVRITHIPTGVVVQCQQERSQGQNRMRAMTLLRSRIFDKMQEEAHAKTASARKVQVGSGDRSEKIRTYNFPQSRVTDHRVGVSLHNLEMILDGGIEGIVTALAEADRQAKLAASKPS